ncbi:MAG: adenosylcobinamide amidohydrolase [Clostridiales bacterium]|nr:adenosylcobinamide amidohydrolase [Clostridiales bacterium]
MTIHTFSSGDVLERYEKSLVIRFAGPRNVLSTAPHNGGYTENLKYVFNQDCKTDSGKEQILKAPTYAEHIRVIASELGLDPLYACGIITAADMLNACVVTETYAKTSVTAVVTGGIDVNGGRVGDPTDQHEPEVSENPPAGTINIMLHINANLPAGTLARALVTCTEAKTAALQELLAPSVYSSGIATGSGTDSTIIISNPESAVYLTWAGKHAKLGELIGRAVKTAVKEALFLQTGLCAESQLDLFSRIGRYGVTKKSILSAALDSADTNGKLDLLAKQENLVVYTSLFVHLLDQLQWGLIGPAAAYEAARTLLSCMGMDSSCLPKACTKETEAEMISAYIHGILSLLE